MPGWLKVLLVLSLIAGSAAGYLYLLDPQLGRKLLRGTPLAPPASVTRAYKWRDATGAWQLTDSPPPDGTRYEVLETRDDDNVVPEFAPKKN